MRDFRFKVYCGSLYNHRGCIIEQPSFIYDLNGGVMKYGEAEQLKEYYDDTVKKYSEKGFYDIIEDLQYVELDKYNGILSVEEICTLLNYFTLCSANGERIHNILNMDEDSLKKEIEKLSSIGY